MMVRSASAGGARILHVGAYPRLLRGGSSFVRGDADSSGKIDLSDRILFLDPTRPPAWLDAADGDDDGILGITDAIRVFGWLFTGGPAPEAPGPRPGLALYANEDCGEDSTEDMLGCEVKALTCQ